MKDEPAVTQEQLDALSLGDAVFHKAFGSGRIVNLNDDYIEVTFANDDKRRNRRGNLCIRALSSRDFCGLGRLL